MANERIYIVEDERIIAIDLQRRLERLGYVVCGSASDAEEALAGIRSTKPDLILMDIVLPGAVDGIDVAVQVRRELNVPVIFLSAYTDARTLERAKAANPLGYILKPFKERELATMLEMALFKSVADERIREKEQLFAAILNSTTDAILVTGLDTEIRFLNPEAEQILEISDAEARDQRLTDLATFSDMESGEPVVIPRLADGMQPVKARGVRLTNRKQNSFVVEISITREDSDPRKQPNVIVSFKDTTALHAVTDSLKFQTSHDTLTGLLNRNELALRLNATLASLANREAKASLIYVDIDHFKVVNDSCGTQAGDLLIKETAVRVRSRMAGGDYAARVGGDDFAFVRHERPARDGLPTALEIAKEIVDAVAASPFSWNGKNYRVTASAAVIPLDAGFRNEHEAMIAAAETLAAARDSGGNRVFGLDGDGRATNPRASVSEWLGRIQDALSGDGFRLYYQPIRPLTDELARPKVEILLRMAGPDETIIPPSEFIPIAERYNIMPTVDRWVIRNAFAAFSRLREKGDPLSNAIFCVNLSGASLLDGGIIGYIIDALDGYAIPPGSVCLEVTETNAILNLEEASRFIRILRERGCTFALDDFGSGFSSFSYLKNLPVDYLKIDGCFIRNMDRDPVDYTMVQAIASMCRVLGLKTIGEFAENADIIEKLRDIGVDYAQGYGISKPLPLEPDV